jgi:putative ABC transport system permease protein
MQTLLQDLRYGARMLIKQPVITAVAILTLALGIGANSAIFSVVNAVLLRPLPFKEPDKLIKLWETFYPDGFGTVSVPNLKDWREQNTGFTELAAYQVTSLSLQGAEHPERIPTATVSPNFFSVLGVAPQLGRALAEGEDQPGNEHVIVLSDQLWRRNFGADPDIVNKSVMLSGEKYTVVGVMPPGFRFPSRATEIWAPLVPSERQRANRGNHWLFTLGRLKPGVTLEQAWEQMRAIARRLEEQYPGPQSKRSVRLIPLQEETVQFVRPALWTLLGAVGFVLLVACANVANLLLARAAARRREIALRMAIGAGRWRLIRQFLTEGVMLAVLGGTFGLLVAKWGLSGLLALAGPFLPRASEVNLDERVLVFTLGLSLVTGVIFGSAPALQLLRANVQGALKEGGNAGEGPQRNRLRGMLVVAEVALALVLLVGAGLLIKSFARLQETDAGFRAENVLTMSIALPPTKYSTPQAITNFYQQLLERVSALPGVQAAGVINFLPIQRTGYNGDIKIEGEGPYPPGQAPLAGYRMASSDYFRALGIPLVAGRFFNARDQEKSEPVVIVNQTLARRHFPNQNPIGKRLSLGDDDDPWMTIVGVVGDVKQSGLTQSAQAEIFMPYTQSQNAGMSLAVRTTSTPTTLTGAIRHEVQTLDPAQPIYNVQPMEEVITASISDRRLNMLLLGIFAAVATTLALIGIYSVMSYAVTQSTREIGIRMALGAERRDIFKLIIGQGLSLTVIGLLIGLGGAFWLTRFLSRLLFHISATDAATYMTASAAMLAVAGVACYLPARRATRVDPMVALRYE